MAILKTLAASAGLMAALSLSACHHYHEKDPAPGAQIVDTTAISNFAIDEVYKAHPTRALVDSVNVEPAAELGRFMVRVEMTGAPAHRKIYDVGVVEAADGTLSLDGLTTVQ